VPIEKDERVIVGGLEASTKPTARDARELLCALLAGHPRKRFSVRF
jgi:hypothetical protein